MEIFQIIEQYGVPIAVAIAFGFFIWKQNKFIQDTLMEELEEDFGRIEAIIIKLIDQSKLTQLEQKEIKGSLDTIIKINAALKMAREGRGYEKSIKENKLW